MPSQHLLKWNQLLHVLWNRVPRTPLVSVAILADVASAIHAPGNLVVSTTWTHDSVVPPNIDGHDEATHALLKKMSGLAALLTKDRIERLRHSAGLSLASLRSWLRPMLPFRRALRATGATSGAAGFAGTALRRIGVPLGWPTGDRVRSVTAAWSPPVATHGSVHYPCCPTFRPGRLEVLCDPNGRNLQSLVRSSNLSFRPSPPWSSNFGIEVVLQASSVEPINRLYAVAQSASDICSWAGKIVAGQMSFLFVVRWYVLHRLQAHTPAP